MDDLGEGFALTAQVQASLDPHRVCGFMGTALESLVEALEGAPSTPVQTLEILGQGERHQQLVEWNATEAEYPADLCIHELFEQQVRERPGSVAVVCEDQELTYQELNVAANKLAHHLRALGVGPDTLVAICLERSLDMVVGLAGGPEGRRRLRPFGSGLPARAADLHARRQRPGSSPDPRPGR